MKNSFSKLLKLMICVLLLLAAVFSYFHLSGQLDHECCGEDCIICEHISQSKELLRNYEELLIVFFFLFIVYRFIYFENYHFCCQKLWLPLPVYKIRFNN